MFSTSVILAIVAGLVLVVFILKTVLSRDGSSSSVKSQNKKSVEKKPQKKDYGTVQILFASQTGTAAKMAENFGQQAEEHGFQPIIIDLKDLKAQHFKKNQLSVFFMSNTGQGDPPDNSVLFMKMLSSKKIKNMDLPPQLQVLTDNSWKKLNYTVFGLGNTQYEHYNKIGIDTDKGLQEKGANRVYKLGLGDNNASLEDDYVDWKLDLWDSLKLFRESNPLSEDQQSAKLLSSRSLSLSASLNIEDLSTRYLSKKPPTLAHWRFLIIQSEQEKKAVQEAVPLNVDELNFRTKAHLKAVPCQVARVQERRQNTEDGSSLQIMIRMPGNPEYETAGNLALWPQADPQLVKKVAEYFKVNPKTVVTIEGLDDKKLSLGFVYPITIQKMLTKHIDLQHRLTKSLLKKLAKFASKDQKYFLDNSNHKTTEEYKRITEHQHTSLIQLITDFQLDLAFEDFIEMAESVQPRLFTIASSYKAEKQIAIVASIVKDGLISKHLERKPVQLYGQLRKSTFSDAMKWQKVIFVSAGTGFAPFRGYLQQKQLLLKQNKLAPLVTLFFGVKHYEGDFIYREQVQEWIKDKVIDRFHPAYSRDPLEDGTFPNPKLYVQHLLVREKEQLKQFFNDEKSALYLCGSLAMGNDVLAVLGDFLMKEMNQDEATMKETIKNLQKEGRFVKELW